HKTFMKAAIQASQSAIDHGNHPFGAVLVQDGEIILTAENTVITEKDITGHAELNLVRQAYQTFSPEILAQCTLYTSTEPCPMCAGAIYAARIPRLVIGCSAETLARLTGSDFVVPCRELYARSTRTPEVIGPVLEKEAFKIHQAYWKL
ncbi:MAG: nucleoside deaminase, partial [Anaerolineaceae bacterium]|nr:nucleoside deaminase [Anaerolineaceae bacterium]